jgi:hypothetical protein
VYEGGCRHGISSLNFKPSTLNKKPKGYAFGFLCGLNQQKVEPDLGITGKNLHFKACYWTNLTFSGKT